MMIESRMRYLLAALVLSAVASPSLAERKFVAGAAKMPDGVTITNDRTSVVAWQFDGDIRRALVRLRSSPRKLSYSPYGAAVYDSGAAIRVPLSPEMAALIREAAAEHGVDPRLVTEVARRESSFRPGVVSNKGAQGVMQLMPATARFLGVKDAFDPRENIFGGTRYLRMLLDTFRGDLDLALAAYNAGPGAVEKYGGIPPYRETIAYVAAIRARYDAAVR
jgi:soluble lytic murein transglycosylase-like protein